MNVALVYNQKKEDTKPENDHEPPDENQNKLSELNSDLSEDTYAEWDTFETINSVREALSEFHNVTLIEADEYAYQKFLHVKPDIVFNIAEGFNGVSRESQIPAILELLQIPYTGSDPLTLGICLDKARTKEILSYYGISTPRFSVINSISEMVSANIDFPSIVKPKHEGSSKGIFNSSIVRNWDELISRVTFVIETYRQPALVEEFLDGREFTVALLGNGKDVKVLPIVEMKFDSLPTEVNPIYSYEAKWIWDNSESPLNIFECPANLPVSLKTEIEDICLNTFNVMRCRDWCRIDVRLDSKGVPNILELNPLPGILPKPEDNSCFPKAARTAGMNYKQLIQEVLNIAAKRYGLL